MAGLDNLLAKSLSSVIKDNLSERTLRKIENRLFEKYGITLTQSIEDFHKLDSVLREFFGAGADGLEKRILENVCTMEDTKSKEYVWISIEDPSLTKVILEAFGDDDKKKILTTLIDEPRIVAEILKVCDLPQTSGYRKINSLISDGLLTIQGHIITHDGKKVNKYLSVFENVKINIIKDKVTIKVQITKDSLNKSFVIPLIQNL